MLAAFVFFVSACSHLKPHDSAPEYALPVAENALWAEVDQRVSGDWVIPLNTGNEAMEWRLRAIDSATASIDLQTFLWEDDTLGLAVVRHLFDAADRGVRIRILLDDSFTVTHEEAIRGIDLHENIELRIYNPFKRRSDNLARRLLINLGDFSRLDHRMHNKALLIDNQISIIGGRNLANEYFGDHELSNFRDLELITGGPHVQETSNLFNQFWNNPWTFPESEIITDTDEFMTPTEFTAWLNKSTPSTSQETPTTRRLAWETLIQRALPSNITLFADIPALDNPAHHDELPTQLAEELIDVIDLAAAELILVSAYLIPTEAFECAVERAEQRGVRVRILTNSLRSNNHLAAHSAYRKHIHRLIDHGADVHEVRAFAKDRHIYMQTPVNEKQLGLHAKFMIVDDTITFIGSANLDARSLRLNTEMGLLIESAELNREIREFIKVDFDKRNAWHLQPQPDGSIRWVSDDESLSSQPADSHLQRLEDWFIGILPIDGEM